MEDFTKAIDLKPDESSYFEARLYIYNSENDLGRALGDLNHLIALKPDQNQPLHVRANLYFKLNKNDESLADYEKVLAKDPKNVPALAGKGEVIAKQGNLRAGAEQLRRRCGWRLIPRRKMISRPGSARSELVQCSQRAPPKYFPGV